MTPDDSPRILNPERGIPDRVEEPMPKCLECEAEIELDESVEAGEIVDCPDCGTEFEVRSTHPASIAYAPKEEEDWGE